MPDYPAGWSEPYPEEKEMPLTVTITPTEFIDKVKEKYKNEFGKLNDQAYFIAGFLLAVFQDMGNPDSVVIENKNSDQTKS